MVRPSSRAASQRMLDARRRAFTLVELLVVVAVIVILVGVLLVIIKGAMMSAAKTSDLNLVMNIETGVTSFHADTGKYPPTHNVPPDATKSFGNGLDGTQSLGTCLVGQIDKQGRALGCNINGIHVGPYLLNDPKFVVLSYQYYTQANPTAPIVATTIQMSGRPASPGSPAFVDARGVPILYYAANPNVGASGSIWDNATHPTVPCRFNGSDNTGLNTNIPATASLPTMLVDGSPSNTNRYSHAGGIQMVFTPPANMLQIEPVFANPANQMALGGAQYLLFAAGASGLFSQASQSQYINGQWASVPVDNTSNILAWGP